MKKFLLFLLILLIGFGVYIVYDNYINKGIPKLNVEEQVVNIDELFIYGTHLSLQGSVIQDENLDLVLYNGDFIPFKINISDENFSLSDTINEGMDLESIPVGNYFAFLRSSTKDENDKDIFRYYILKNNTDYKETTYYTFSNVGNKILINTDDEYETLTFNVSKNNDNNVYDVVIDPGHGGMDSGANKNGNKESEYTMKIASNLKKKMEDNGIKVKLTREDGQLTTNELLEDYGNGGRAVINHEVHAKYLFSIHLNSNASQSVNGVEVYTADNINYDFATNLVKNIVEMTGSSYSTNKINKVTNGVYTRTFRDVDIQSSLAEYARKNMKAYDLTTKSNYYYMIRETGGIMTGAYVDNRNEPKILGNPYFNSNIGSEAYLLELGYLTNTNDLNNIDKNMEKYTDAIVTTFKEVYDNSK